MMFNFGTPILAQSLLNNIQYKLKTNNIFINLGEDEVGNAGQKN